MKKYIFDLLVFALKSVKHASNNSCEILSRESYKIRCQLPFFLLFHLCEVKEEKKRLIIDGLTFCSTVPHWSRLVEESRFWIAFAFSLQSAQMLMTFWRPNVVNLCIVLEISLSPCVHVCLCKYSGIIALVLPLH